MDDTEDIKLTPIPTPTPDYYEDEHGTGVDPDNGTEVKEEEFKPERQKDDEFKYDEYNDEFKPGENKSDEYEYYEDEEAKQKEEGRFRDGEYVDGNDINDEEKRKQEKLKEEELEPDNYEDDEERRAQDHGMTHEEMIAEDPEKPFFEAQIKKQEEEDEVYDFHDWYDYYWEDEDEDEDDDGDYEEDGDEKTDDDEDYDDDYDEDEDYDDDGGSTGRPSKPKKRPQLDPRHAALLRQEKSEKEKQVKQFRAIIGEIPRYCTSVLFN